MKTCSKCGEEKRLDDFHRDSGARDSRSSRCAACATTAASAWYQAHRGHVSARNRQAKFNISPEHYDEMLFAQDGVCAICRRPETKRRNGIALALAVDHDHSCCRGDFSCGSCIRGLLCGRCNHAIGFLGDDPDQIRRAADYVATRRAEASR